MGDKTKTKGISLSVSGDEDTGYQAVISYYLRPVAAHAGGGEFTAVFENGDRSVSCDLTDWKAQQYRFEDNSLILEGRAYLEALNTDINVSIKYSVINEHVVKKQILLEQHNASLLYYRLTNRLEAASEPKSFWSFEQEECTGGAHIEIYPAAGFRYEDGLAVGLLTDSGYKNQWTKNVRRRTLEGGMMALKRMPDLELVKTSNLEERKAGKNYVEMNFGEVKDFRYGSRALLKIPGEAEWIRENSSFLIPLRLKKTLVYRLKFKYRTKSGNIRISLTDESRTKDYSFNFFDKEIEKSQGKWTEITRTFAPVRMTDEEETVYLYIGSDESQSAQVVNTEIDVKDLELLKKTAVSEAYHTLRAGEKAEKTLFLFAEEADSLRELRIASQVRLAEGSGFCGTDEEKIFFADRQMLIWIPEPDDFTPHVVPSLNYSMDMYARDSFWTAVAGYDKEVNEGVFYKWAMSLDDRGCVRTIWTPYVGDQENSPNDSNLYFIIWAYLNKQRFNSRIDTTVVQRALDFCRSMFDPNREGRYICRTPAWMDIIWLKKGILFAVNQGLYVNALKCAKKLGCDVTDTEITNAIEAYRSLYDEKAGYMCFSEKSYDKWDMKTPSSLMGEFVSLWLWNEKILPDQAVIGTLEALPVISGCSPCLVRANNEFCTQENKPFEPDFYANPGTYINGGSWFLYEYLAYVAGLRHGWDKAEKRMQERIRAEFDTIPDEPFSHEYLALIGPTEGYHRVFGWNTFMLVANEVAGLRKV